jgi:hypothetical protein
VVIAVLKMIKPELAPIVTLKWKIHRLINFINWVKYGGKQIWKCAWKKLIGTKRNQLL